MEGLWMGVKMGAILDVSPEEWDASSLEGRSSTGMSSVNKPAMSDGSARRCKFTARP